MRHNQNEFVTVRDANNAAGCGCLIGLVAGYLLCVVARMWAAST